MTIKEVMIAGINIFIKIIVLIFAIMAVNYHMLILQKNMIVVKIIYAKKNVLFYLNQEIVIKHVIYHMAIKIKVVYGI